MTFVRSSFRAAPGRRLLARLLPMALLTLFALVVIGARQAGAAGGWLPVGPFGGAEIVAPDPAVERRVFAAVAHLLYRSDDAGAHWALVQRFDAGTAIAAIAPSPFAGHPLFVAAGRRLWRSADAGASFVDITPPGVDLDLRVAASSARPGLVYAYQRLGVFRSDDDGASWTTTSRSDIATFFDYRLVPHLTIPDLVFALNPTFVSRSADGGRTWTRVLDQSSAYFPQLHSDRMRPERIVVSLGAAIAISDDGGVSFRTVARPALFTGFAIGPLDSNRWLGVATTNAPAGRAGSLVTLWETRDEGASWREAGSFEAPGRAPFSIVAQTGVADGFFVWNGADMRRTDNAGLSFVAATRGLREIADVPVDSRDTLYAATPHGVRRSTDAGDGWTRLNEVIAGTTTNGGGTYSLGDAVSPLVAASAIDPSRIVALDWQQSVIALSRDGGASWFAAAGVARSPITHRGALDANRLDPDAFDAIHVVQAGGTFGSTGPRLIESADFGATTTTLGIASVCSPQQGLVYSIARHSHLPARRVVGRACGVIYSDDGASWTEVAVPSVLALAAWQGRPGQFVAGTVDGLFVSEDHAASWRQIAFAGHAVRGVAFDPADAAHWVVAIDDGVWSSLDAGASWTRLDDGLPPVHVTGVGFAAGVLFAATDEGLYRCASAECTAGAPIRTSRIVEFHNVLLDHYFIAEEGDETAGIDVGAAGPGWVRTGQSFAGFLPSGTFPFDAAPVCRFYGTPGVGPNSHFYTAAQNECAAVARDPGWTLESPRSFVIGAAVGDCSVTGCSLVCPSNRTPVYRLYNGRFAANDSNHRYTTDTPTLVFMQAQGWIPEGIVFCAP